MGFLQPFQQFRINLLFALHQYMVGPAIGVRLRCGQDAGGIQAVGQPEGDEKENLGAAFRTPERDKGKAVPLPKCDLRFGYLDFDKGKRAFDLF